MSSKKRGILWVALCDVALSGVVLAADPYARAGYRAVFTEPGSHFAEGSATILDDRTLQIDHFTYDGTAPLVYFYLGATDSQADFENGIPIGPLLDRAYVDETVFVQLPIGQTLDGYAAISVWCAQFDVNFSSASFVPAYARADGTTDVSVPGFHDVQGTPIILDERTIHVEHFSYDGTAPAVYFYLGVTDSEADFENGIPIGPQLTRAYVDESITVQLPAGQTLNGYGALSVWCVAAKADFGSGTFPRSPADFDIDGDADLDDFGHFQACTTGANQGPPSPGCEDADLDGDNDIDQEDFGVLQACLSGPGRPADPSCAD